MKASDYIVEFIYKKGITDVFGYPGGMVTHLMDSLNKYNGKISSHLNYHEQASSFAACGYAQASGKVGVAYATSGPGATNLITGIAHAYFDSVPTLFITGQVNTYEAKGELPLRQKGFQETDIVSIVKPITKYAKQITEINDLKKELEKAYQIATSGRCGPVLLDIPMNIHRMEIETQTQSQESYIIENKEYCSAKSIATILKNEIINSKRPCILVGNGVKITGSVKEFRKAVDRLSIPIISSMPAFDVMSEEDNNYFGFIGAYGHRSANFIIAKSDLIISLGSRLDCRQVSTNTKNFAPNAKLIRFDIDSNEFLNKIKDDEIQVCSKVNDVINSLHMLNSDNDYTEWLRVCNEINNKLCDFDNNKIQNTLLNVSKAIPDNAIITTDVGQNQVWIAQYFKVKPNQQVLFSSSHGAMGYSLPAAIGAYYATKRPVFCITGDGGFQMNIQELEFIKRENLPIKIIVINNNALGMIRHFQEMYFDSIYTKTIQNEGYSSPDLQKIAYAYNIKYERIFLNKEFDKALFIGNNPLLVEININEPTYVFPKLAINKPPQDQEPAIDSELFDFIMSL